MYFYSIPRVKYSNSRAGKSYERSELDLDANPPSPPNMEIYRRIWKFARESKLLYFASDAGTTYESTRVIFAFSSLSVNS
jgi:hypothetical protein